jgi:AAHS family 4-hydroxybenzoate transporter-like MFS transporter
VNRSMEKPSVIDVGQIIDESKLNPVSVRVILLCGLIMLMDGYDYAIITVAARPIMQEWNIGPSQFGWALSAAFLGYLLGAPLFGMISDRIGRKKTLIFGACVFSIGTLLVYFSHSIWSLIPMRVFAGIGIGGAVPCAITLTSEYSPSKGRGKYVSVMYSGFLIGIVLGGFVASSILKNIGWRTLFLIGFLAPIAAIVLLALKLPESARWLSTKYRTEQERRVLGQLVHKMQPGIQIGTDTRFVASGSRQNKSSIKELFDGKLAWVTPLIWSYYLISSIAVFFIGSWAPTLLGLKGFTDSMAAFITGLNGIPVAIGCLLSGYFYDMAGFRRGAYLYVIAAGCVVFMGGLAPWGFVAMLIISGFFINSGHMAVTILAPIVYPPNCRNQGAGMAIAVARIGAMTGPSLGGWLLETKLSMSGMMALVAIPLLISAVLCYVSGRQYDFHFSLLYRGKR